MAWWDSGVQTSKEPHDRAQSQCPICKLYFHGPCGSCDITDQTSEQQDYCSATCWKKAGRPGDPMCIIWSNEHNAWWAPNSMGYICERDDAGRYTREEAQKICKDANRNLGPGTGHVWNEIWMYDPDWVVDL